MLRETFALHVHRHAPYRLSRASRVSILNIAMTGTGVIAARGDCLFIAERKGQRHASNRIESDQDQDLERKPVKLARPCFA